MFRLIETPESIGAKGYDLKEMIIIANSPLSKESEEKIKDLSNFAYRVYYIKNN